MQASIALNLTNARNWIFLRLLAEYIYDFYIIKFVIGLIKFKILFRNSWALFLLVGINNGNNVVNDPIMIFFIIK